MTGEIKGEMKTAKPFADRTPDSVKGEMGHFCSKTLFKQLKALHSPDRKHSYPQALGLFPCWERFIPKLGTHRSQGGNDGTTRIGRFYETKKAAQRYSPSAAFCRDEATICSHKVA